MFDDGPMLYRYFMKDGSTWVEEIQCIPWSSGPCIFTKLVQENGDKEIKWSQEEIDKNY